MDVAANHPVPQRKAQVDGSVGLGGAGLAAKAVFDEVVQYKTLRSQAKNETLLVFDKLWIGAVVGLHTQDDLAGNVHTHSIQPVLDLEAGELRKVAHIARHKCGAMSQRYRCD